MITDYEERLKELFGELRAPYQISVEDLATDRPLTKLETEHVFDNGYFVYVKSNNEKKSRSIFTNTIPIYQNPEIKRPSVDSYEILHDYRYRTATGEYKKVILVHFDKMPDWLRGWTDGERFAEINQEDYKPYVVIAHELTHIRRRGWPEYMVRTYSPRDIRTLEELRARFSEFDIVFI